uniref:Uncharacterized protein n=1 Tax=Euplotes harpa TaxID=151035 RepID=A0A7S3J8J6_9SPIT|mmetsp:Transcript_22741/g.26115  ORF Transcript_22741/g.26115 Transcript_22741/m.26115 type:complete len:153 (+) Transcript_22741:400-858(+)
MSPSMIIWRLIKSFVCATPLMVCIPQTIKLYSWMNSNVVSLHLDEDGRFIHVSSAVRTRKLKIADIKPTDKMSFTTFMHMLPKMTDRYAPIQIREFMYVFDRNGKFYHPDIFEMILKFYWKDVEDPESLERAFHRVDTSEYTACTIKEATAE